MKTSLTSAPTTTPDALQRLVDDQGICHLIFDTPGSAANIFTRETMAQLEAHLLWVAQSRDLNGLLLRSAKPKIFIAGADLNTMLDSPAESLGELISTGQRVFTLLASLPLPKIAAIHGACLGGGFELALACDYRIASDDPATRIGLPETQLGLVPAWGGCTRLPRLIGVRGACHVILKGTPFTAFMAHKHGLIDAVVPAHCLLQRAIQWLLHPVNPDRHGTMDRFVAPVIRSLTRGHLQRSTHGNYPALPAALELISKAPWRSVEESMAAERKTFETLMALPGSRNLIRLFFARERAKKLRVPGVARKVEHVAVVGAGVMGCGIAYWLSTRGLSVQLTDINAAALAKAEARLRKSCTEAVTRHLLTRTEAQAVMDRIVLATNDVSFKTADLIIEAAVEDPAIKRTLFASLRPKLKSQAIIASNTSAIPLGGLLDNPNFLGLHFFNPVHAMPLVEIVRPAHASDDAVATAVEFVKAIGKLPLVVQDSPGFLVNRVLMPCLLEAARMVHDGAGIASVDQAMLSFGMPMGPLRLLDEVGLDVALHVVKTLAAAFPNTASVPAWIEERVQSGALGRKSGHGYYLYADGKEPVPADHAKIRPRDIIDAQRRLPLLLTNEAARCLDEGVAATAEDVDLGMVLGTGYAPFRGGPLRHADALGLEVTVRSLQALEAEFGLLYTPARGLVARATNHLTYYPEDHTK
jgi:3-hydroxyacyl-CoA dehydrogenase/enoyl-CoA hydratase/3-hydroxybutyryl-CoA epimerase